MILSSGVTPREIRACLSSLILEIFRSSIPPDSCNDLNLHCKAVSLSTRIMIIKNLNLAAMVIQSGDDQHLSGSNIPIKSDLIHSL